MVQKSQLRTLGGGPALGFGIKQEEVRLPHSKRVARAARNL